MKTPNREALEPTVDASKETPTVSKHASELVVVGSSAGGIEALGVLVSSLAADFPAPLVLAQHLDPRRPSHLGSILERRSKLPVVTVVEPTPLEPGKIYVVPSNQHVVIQDGSVNLETDHGDRPRPSVDLLLSTAAKSYGDQLIAVVLTGSGSDGAAGAVDVKSAGGTVIIQNPATAAHPSMPQALPPTVVDHVEDIEQIGALLTSLLRPPPLSEHVVSDDVFAQILQIVGRQSAIDFRQYKPSTILRRIGRRMAIRRTHSLAEYRDYLESHPQEIGDLVMSLLIKVTEFFRDGEAYERLRHDVFPVLLESARARGNVLRIWSAGCATGEEAYTLAFLTSDLLGRELPDWNVKIFATDLDGSAIHFARRGFYPPNTISDLPEEYRTRFFEHTDGGARVAKSIRQMVIFGHQDLNRGVPFPRIDLVLCRNLLIYFKPEMQRELLDLFSYSLHQTRGFLFLGKAETVRPSKAVFEIVNKKWRIYRCVAGPSEVPRLVGVPMALVAEAGQRRRSELPAEPQDREGEISYLRRLNEVVLRFLGVGAILIDSSYRILTMNSAARRMLGVREGANDQDFLHTVRELPYGAMRNAIDRVFRERATTSVVEVPLEGRAGGEPRWVTLSLAPSQLEGTQFNHALITVQDVTEVVQLRQRITTMESDQRQLSDELGASNRRLSEVNKELQDANEELQASNEEMMLTQEELQATNEEFEATNEELQATNEELETNNEELQATNEELETTNEELVARSSELQELTRILTLERLRLSEMIELAPFHVGVVSGPEMLVEDLNASASLYGFGLSRGETLEGVMNSELQPLVEGVRETYRTGRPWKSPKMKVEHVGASGERSERLVEFTVIPNRDHRGQVMGAMIYAMDLTDVHGREEQARLERYRLMMEHAHQVALALFDADTKTLLYASPAFIELVSRGESAGPSNGGDRSDPTQLAGRLWQDLGFLAPGDARASFEEAVRTRESKRLSRIRLRWADLRETVWDCSLIPVVSDDKLHYVVVTAVDITEQARAHEELQRADRLKDQFLSLASHELRTPLTPLGMYSEVMKRMLAEEDRGEEWTKRMQDVVRKFENQIAHIARLTDDLIDVAKLESDRLSIDRKPVDLRSVLIRAREQSLAAASGPTVKLALPDGDRKVIVEGDEQRLVQVIGNLLNNASRHAPGSKWVEVTLRVHESEGAAQAVIEVSDEGPGIPPDVMRNLFTRFSKGARVAQSSRSGLGLGLFISRGIVEQHGGTIRARSEPGHGAVFTVELPISR